MADKSRVSVEARKNTLLIIRVTDLPIGAEPFSWINTSLLASYDNKRFRDRTEHRQREQQRFHYHFHHFIISFICRLYRLPSFYCELTTNLHSYSLTGELKLHGIHGCNSSRGVSVLERGAETIFCCQLILGHC